MGAKDGAADGRLNVGDLMLWFKDRDLPNIGGGDADARFGELGWEPRNEGAVDGV